MKSSAAEFGFLKSDLFKLVPVLFAISAFLVFCHILSLTVLSWSFWWERLFNLDFENNVPTWFSGLIWLGSAAASFLISMEAGKWRKRILWIVASSFFLYLGCDEVAALHERLVRFIDLRLFGSDSNFDTRSWVFILAPLAIVFCVWMGFQLRRDFQGHSKISRIIVLGLVLFFTGAAGCDLITWAVVRIESLNFLQRYLIIIEESLEMIGSIFIFAGLTEFYNARNCRLRKS